MIVNPNYLCSDSVEPVSFSIFFPQSSTLLKWSTVCAFCMEQKILTDGKENTEYSGISLTSKNQIFKGISTRNNLDFLAETLQQKVALWVAFGPHIKHLENRKYSERVSSETTFWTETHVSWDIKRECSRCGKEAVSQMLI